MEISADEVAGRGPAPGWLKIATAIEWVTEAFGRVTIWLLGAMILIGATNAVVRYASRFTGVNFSSNAWFELQWYLFSIVFLLGAAYALKHDAHVRVDLIYGQLSPRGKAWIDLIGTILFLVPFSVFMLLVSYPSVISSWEVREMSPDPGGLARYPIKALVLVAFVLLLLQGLAEILKQIAVLRGVPLRAGPGHHLPEDV